MPMKIKDVKSFLGFANFYQRFIQNFIHTARPLNELKGKKEWIWNKEHDKAFEELKEKITSQPVLSLLKREEKFRIETDTSGHAIEGVLCYKTKEWTDFSKDRDKIQIVVIISLQLEREGT